MWDGCWCTIMNMQNDTISGVEGGHERLSFSIMTMMFILCCVVRYDNEVVCKSGAIKWCWLSPEIHASQRQGVASFISSQWKYISGSFNARTARFSRSWITDRSHKHVTSLVSFQGGSLTISILSFSHISLIKNIHIYTHQPNLIFFFLHAPIGCYDVHLRDHQQEES